MRRADGSSAPVEPEAAGAQDLGGGLRRISGQALSLDCEGAHPKLSVLVGTTTMQFEVTDPKQISVTHNASSRFEFACGPMDKFSVTVDYAPVAGSNVTGALKAIRF